MSLKRKRDDDDGIVQQNRIDAEGDVILLFSGSEKLGCMEGADEYTEKFLVSSKVLSVASRYFKQLFQSKIGKDGSRNDSLPVIDLGKEDIKAVRSILNRLHFRFLRVSSYIHNLNDLEAVTRLCYKWKCTEALSILMRCLIEGFMVFDEVTFNCDSVEYFKALAFTAHLFDDQRLLQTVVFRAACVLSKAEREKLLELFLRDTSRKEEYHTGQ